MTDKKKNKVPHGMRLYNGSFYVIVTRQFIDWVMTNQVPQDFLNWTHDTWGPEEIIWATLSRYSGAPGSEPDNGRSIGEGDSSDGALARAIKWEWRAKLKNPPYPECFQGMGFTLKYFIKSFII